MSCLTEEKASVHLEKRPHPKQSHDSSQYTSVGLEQWKQARVQGFTSALAIVILPSQENR